MTLFKHLLITLKKELLNHTYGSEMEIRNGLIEDGTQFLYSIWDDLERWWLAMAEGRMSQEKFEWLIWEKKDLAEMKALKQQQLSQEQIDEYRDKIIATIEGSTFRPMRRFV